jgi:hypothetical protein
MARSVMRDIPASRGIVLSVTRLVSDTGDTLVDTRTEPGPGPKRVRLSNGGILFLPRPGDNILYLVTFNVGQLDNRRCGNDHHAETQVTRWIQEQPPSWRARIRTILIANRSRGSDKKGFSPCNACCTDLALFLTGLKSLPGSRGVQAAGIFWKELYDRGSACGHPTDRANLDRLTAAGWALGGPRPAQRELSLTGR